MSARSVETRTATLAEAAPHRLRQRTWLPGILVGAAAVVAALVLVFRAHWTMTDLGVYRRGGGQLLHGSSLYVDTPALPYTYPPFSAVLFVPLYLAGAAAAAVMTAGSVAAYGWIVWSVGRRLSLSSKVIACLGLLGLATEPIWHTLTLGQVNLLLALLVVFDVFVLPPRYRGWLIGIAAGIKLVPAVFVFYYLLKRDWRAVRQSAFGGLASILIGFAATPSDSMKYWTKLFFSTDHVRGVAYVGNQSLNGDLVRLLKNEHPPTALYAGLAVLALLLGVAAARQQLQRDDDVAALVCIAVAGLLVSPISWTHHWVWLVPASMVLVARGLWWSAAGIGVITLVAPMWFTPATQLREFHQVWWQAALCLSYAFAGLWFLFRLTATTQADRMPSSET